MSYCWGIVLGILIVIEIATVNLVTIWFAIGALGAMIAALLGGGLWLQLLVFIGLSAFALILTRPMVRKWLKPRVEPTNADRSIGKDAVVITTIDPQKGEGLVNLEGNEWSAVSQSNQMIPEKTIVVVTGIRGAKLIVKPKMVNEKEK